MSEFIMPKGLWDPDFSFNSFVVNTSQFLVLGCQTIKLVQIADKQKDGSYFDCYT